MQFLLLIISITMLAGCVGLPPGKAPDGSIVDPKLTTKEYSKVGARNYMLTSLSMFCLQNFPQGAKFNVDFKNLDRRAKSCSLDVLCSVRQSVPIKIAQKSDADYRLTGEFSNNIWSIRLIDLKTKKVVWLEQLKIEKDK